MLLLEKKSLKTRQKQADERILTKERKPQFPVLIFKIILTYLRYCLGRVLSNSFGSEWVFNNKHISKTAIKKISLRICLRNSMVEHGITLLQQAPAILVLFLVS